MPEKPLRMKERIMKKMSSNNDELLAEYKFDYSKAKSNRFASKNKRVVVVLDEDLSEIFRTPEAVNKALRAMVEAVLPQ